MGHLLGRHAEPYYSVWLIVDLTPLCLLAWWWCRDVSEKIALGMHVGKAKLSGEVRNTKLIIMYIDQTCKQIRR